MVHVLVLLMMVVKVLQERMMNRWRRSWLCGYMVLRRWWEHLANIAADERIIAAKGKVLR